LSNITQDASKFYYVISHLDNRYAAVLEDVITNPHPQAVVRESKLS